MAGIFDIKLENTGEILYLVDERHYPEEEDDEDDPAYIEEDYVLTWLHASHLIVGDKEPYSKVIARLAGDERYLVCRCPLWEIVERGKGLKDGDEEKIMAQVTKRMVEIWYETAVPHSTIPLQGCKIRNDKAKLEILLSLAKFAKEDNPTQLTEFVDSTGYILLFVYFQGKKHGAVEIRKKLGYNAYVVTNAREVDPLKYCSKLKNAEKDLLMDFIMSISPKIEKCVNILRQGDSSKSAYEIWESLTYESLEAEAAEKIGIFFRNE